MQKYITHHRYKKMALCGERLNLPYGTELNAANNLIATLDGKAVCFSASDNAKRHFACNDDGRGLERGALTYALAYGERTGGNGFRFSDGEQKLLARDWGHFLRQDVDVILFNEDFFAADVDELEKLADALNAVRGGGRNVRNLQQ